MKNLKPEVAKFVTDITQKYAAYPSIEEVSLDKFRQIAEQVRQDYSSNGPHMARIEHHAIPFDDGQVRIRIYSPSATDNLPCLFYLHGGGWVFFNLDTHDRLMREYAHRAQVAVIGIDYSLAPEHKFPRQMNEIVTVIQWCHQHHQQLGINPDKFALGGDSAGANLSMATWLKFKQLQQPEMLKALILNYGLFGQFEHTDSFERYADGRYSLSAGEIIWFLDAYLENKQQLASPFVTPANADLTGTPPCCMIIADHDVLYDDQLKLRDELKRCGVAVSDKVYPGTTHSFLESISLGGIAEQAFNDTSQFLKTVLSANKTIQHNNKKGTSTCKNDFPAI